MMYMCRKGHQTATPPPDMLCAHPDCVDKWEVILPVSSNERSSPGAARLPVVLVVDGSAQMQGAPSHALKAGLELLAGELKSSGDVGETVELLVIRYGGEAPEVLADWKLAKDFEAPLVSVAGAAPLGAAVRMALAKIGERKAHYAELGLNYRRPWLCIAAGSQPTDADWEGAAADCMSAEQVRAIEVFAVALRNEDLALLSRFSDRPQLAGAGSGGLFQRYFGPGDHHKPAQGAHLPPLTFDYPT